MSVFDLAELAAALDGSGFARLPRVTVDLSGWPAPAVAIDATGMVGNVDADTTHDRLVEVRDVAMALVGELGWTPVFGDVEFPSNGLPSYYANQMVPYRDPAGFDSNIADPRWGFEPGIVDELFVPELPDVAWDLADSRRPGHAMRDRDEIVHILELKAAQYDAQFGARPSPDEIAAATDPNGEPILDLTVADWWMHRWVSSVLEESALVEWRASPGVWHTIDCPTLFLLPSAHPGIAGLLPSGSGEFTFAQGHQAWAEFVAKWQQDWGAQMVSSGLASTFTVERPPTTVAAAIPLAVEHWFFYDGPALGGDSVFEYACSLVGRSAWNLGVNP